MPACRPAWPGWGKSSFLVVWKWQVKQKFGYLISCMVFPRQGILLYHLQSQSSVFVCLAPCSCCWCCCCGCGFNQSRLVEAKVADLKEVSITYATFLGSDSLCFPFKNIIIVFWNSEPAGVDRKCRTQITHLPTLTNTQDGLQNKLVYLLNVIQEITIEKYRCLANYCALFTF